MIKPADHHRNVIRVLEQATSRGHAYADFLPGALAIAAIRPSQPARLFVLAGLVIVAAFLLLAGLVPIEKVVVANGSVRPAAEVRIINHQTGGKVADVLVADGDHVTAGQCLLRFDEVATRDDLDKRRQQALLLRLEIARLTAEIEGAPLKPPEGAETAALALKAQQQLLTEHRATWSQQTSALTADISRSNALVQQFDARLRNARQTLSLTTRQESMGRQLVKDGYYSKLRYLQMQREVTTAQTTVDETIAQLAAARHGLAVALAKRNQFETDTRVTAMEAAADRRTRLTALDAEMTQLTHDLESLELRAPIDGVVEALAVKGPGEAAPHDKPLMNIVPDNAPYLVDIQVADRDIHGIHVGQSALLKLHSYDYTRYGKLRAAVVRLATHAEEDPRTHARTYAVTLRPETPHLPNHPQWRLRSGMSLEADLVVGTRTAISYLLEIVKRGADETLRD